MVVFQFGNLNDQWFTGNIIETKVLRTKTRFYISKRNKRCKLKKIRKNPSKMHQNWFHMPTCSLSTVSIALFQVEKKTTHQLLNSESKLKTPELVSKQ
jgi:hypothetical protein